MLDSQKYNIKKSHKNYNIYMKLALKIGSLLFFLQGNSL